MEYKLMTRCLLVVLMSSALGSVSAACVAPDLSDQQVKDIVDKERSVRSDLPKPFPQYRWLVRKNDCVYSYVEYGLPETPDFSQIFSLNQHGVIVDVRVGNE